MSDVKEIMDYFLAPKKTGYDLPKTLTYALILVLAVYLIYNLLKKLKLRIDRRLAVSLAPYVLFGSALRVLQDAGMLDSYLFVTPGIYFLVSAVVLSVLAFSIYLERKKGIPYFKTSFVCGLFLVSLTIANVTPVNFYGPYLVLLFFSPWMLISGIKWSLTNKVVMLIHMFDATTTFVAMNFFGYYEQHIFPTFLIEILGPASFIFVKAIAVVGFLLLIDRFSEDREFSSYLKLIMGILGGATGSRDFIGLLSLVG